MTRQIYLHRLKEALEGLPREEQESAMRYCEEYFDEAGEDQFDQAIRPEKALLGIRKARGHQTSAVFHRILECVLRVFTQRTGRRKITSH